MLAGGPLESYARASVSQVLLLDCFKKGSHLSWRTQVMNLLYGYRASDKLPLSRSQSTMTEPDHTVAIHRAAPNGTVFRPTLWIHEKALRRRLVTHL
jgi:hypothetical protein